MMKAMELHYYGDAGNLHRGDRPVPGLSGGTVLVKVAATSLNPIDPMRASGVMRQMFPLDFPFVPGGDFAGVVEAIGDGVDGLAVGQPVWGYSDAGGAYADFIAVAAEQVAPKPANLSNVQAAALALVGQTGMQALDEAGLSAGQTVLVTGAAGAVGRVAVSYAACLGLTVIAQAAADAGAPLRAAGADRIVERRLRLGAALSDVDAVIDCVGGEVQDEAFGVLRRGGVLVALNRPPSQEVAADRHVRAVFRSTKTTRKSLEALRALVEGGKLRPGPVREYALADAAQAWRDRASGSLKAKAVMMT